LAVRSLSRLGGVQELAGNNVNLTGAPTNPAGTVQIDTIASTVTGIAACGTGIDANGNGDLDAGHVVHLTLTLSEALTVTRTPTRSEERRVGKECRSGLSKPATETEGVEYNGACGHHSPRAVGEPLDSLARGEARA